MAKSLRKLAKAASPTRASPLLHTERHPVTGELMVGIPEPLFGATARRTSTEAGGGSPEYAAGWERTFLCSFCRRPKRGHPEHCEDGLAAGAVGGAA